MRGRRLDLLEIGFGSALSFCNSDFDGVVLLIARCRPLTGLLFRFINLKEISKNKNNYYANNLYN
jgi:hypothetical protein